MRVIIFSITLTFWCFFAVKTAKAESISISNSTINVNNTTINSSVKNSTPITYQDQDYKEKTSQFAAGSTIYILLNSSSDGSLKKEGLLLDANKNIISKTELTGKDNNFIGKIASPQTPGTYYISATVEDSRNKTAIEHSITISSTNGSSAITSHPNNPTKSPATILPLEKYTNTQTNQTEKKTTSSWIVNFINSLLKMILDKVPLKS